MTQVKTTRLFELFAASFFLMAGCEQAAEAPSAAAVTEPASAPVEETVPVFSMLPLIDPNAASEVELGEVPGLSDAAVAAILAGRPFATPTALHAVIGAGLSEADQKSVYERLFVKVGLNSGAEEDYKLIPSTMPAGKLAHEFEEYRPYESIEQFQREMSKYVSGEEVAYLSRYVTLD